ncbi:MAG: histidine phosphatase family protein [Pseudomonadota bacterium]
MINFPRRRRIYLMRHAQAAYVSADGQPAPDPRLVPLTLEGRTQATQQGQTLAKVHFDRVICSGLPRTRETVALVLAEQAHDAPPVEERPALEEIHGLSAALDVPHDPTRRQRLLEDIANPWARGEEPDARFLGGDAFEDFAARVTQAWDAIMEDEDWDTLLLVLHGAVNRMIFNHTLRLPWSGEYCIEQDNGCINIIDVDSSDPRRYLIRAVNLTMYNPTKAGIDRTNMESTAERFAQMWGEQAD